MGYNNASNHNYLFSLYLVLPICGLVADLDKLNINSFDKDFQISVSQLFFFLVTSRPRQLNTFDCPSQTCRWGLPYADGILYNKKGVLSMNPVGRLLFWCSGDSVVSLYCHSSKVHLQHYVDGPPRQTSLFWRETRQRILGHEISPYPEVVRGRE